MDGASDIVSFDPTITYRTVNGAAVDPATLDENGLPLLTTTASADYAYGGRPLPVDVPAIGTATLSGTIVKPNVATDDVRVTVTSITHQCSRRSSLRPIPEVCLSACG